MVHRQGTARTAEVVRRTFRRQHLEKFLPGLEKLGLRRPARRRRVRPVPLPLQRPRRRQGRVDRRVRHQVVGPLPAAAVDLGRRRRVRRADRGQPGDALGLARPQRRDARQRSPRLRRHVADDRRRRRARRLLRRGGPRRSRRTSACGSRPARRRPGPAGELPTVSWDAERLAKVERNYAMDYVRSLLPELCAVLGPADAAAVGRLAGRQIGMQYHDIVVDLLDMADAPLGRRARAAGGGDGRGRRRSTATSCRSRRGGWPPGETWPPEAFEAWNGLWEGFAALHGAPPGAALGRPPVGGASGTRVRGCARVGGIRPAPRTRAARGSSGGSGRAAAVDRDDRAGHVVGLRAGEEADDAGAVLGRADAAVRRPSGSGGRRRRPRTSASAGRCRCSPGRCS